MSDNNAVIMMVVLLLIGAKLIGDGVGSLHGSPPQPRSQAGGGTHSLASDVPTIKGGSANPEVMGRYSWESLL